MFIIFKITCYLYRGKNPDESVFYSIKRHILWAQWVDLDEYFYHTSLTTGIRLPSCLHLDNRLYIWHTLCCTYLFFHFTYQMQK